jgi:hypothetical protein
MAVQVWVANSQPRWQTPGKNSRCYADTSKAVLFNRSSARGSDVALAQSIAHTYAAIGV